jgi:hypothetical protein
MRKALLFVAFVLTACNGRPLTESCPTITRTGTSPTCIVATQCIGTNNGFAVDCSKNDGNCVCKKNDLADAGPVNTVPFNSVYCDTSASTEGVLETMNAACGWNL